MGMKALVVDDNEDVREVVVETLLDGDGPLFEGLEVVEAGDGYDGFEELKKTKFDLIVSDLKMPLIDGELLFKLRESKENLNKKTPSIVLSGNFDEFRPADAEKIVFLDKPIDEEKLIKWAKILLKSKASG